MKVISTRPGKYIKLIDYNEIKGDLKRYSRSVDVNMQCNGWHVFYTASDIYMWESINLANKIIKLKGRKKGLFCYRRWYDRKVGHSCLTIYSIPKKDKKKWDKWKIGYKVVNVVDGKYYSAIIRCIGRKKYLVGKITERNKDYGPLAVFKTCGGAVNFVGNTYTYDFCNHEKRTIFKIEYLPSKEKQLYTLSMRIYEDALPPGTDFADKVKLIEAVK